MYTLVSFVQIIMFLSFLQLSSENKFKKINNCVVHVDNREIDYSILNNTNGYEVTHGNKLFILNICGPASKCGYLNVSACLLNEQNDIKLIGTLNYVYIKQLQIKYRYIDTKNIKFETIIDFKCHRYYETPYILYDSEIGKIYKFVVYTSLVCIKSSPQCKVLDKVNNLQYDITPLHRINREWVVQNVSKELQIYLNPCGGLQHLMRNHVECSYEDTHVCLINKNKVSQNLGVFPSTPKINEDNLSINFTGGSLCGNLSTISTNVVFMCWFKEMGPVLHYQSECEFKIIWKTPVACPYYTLSNDNCTLQNNYLFGNIGSQMNRLYPSEDKEKQLSVDTKIKYNICGTLNSKCNGKKNVSVCLIKEDKEIILGISNATVITKDATMSIFLRGELCDYANQPNSVKVLFRCSYNKKKSEEIIVDHNLCSATIIAYTTEVCRQTNILTDNCTVLANNTEYNLTQLNLNKNNYEVKDPNDSDIVYLLNVCSPIVISEDAFCPLDTAVCRRNNSEPNIYKRFHSIGHSLKSSGLKIEKNKLTITYEGEICLDSFANYQTRIELLCSRETEYEVSVLKEECKYTFIFKTKYACGQSHTSDSVTTAPSISANEKKEEDTIKLEKKQDNLILQNTFNGSAHAPNNMLALKNKTTYTINKQNISKDTYLISTVSIYIPKKVFNFSSMLYNLPEKTNISSQHKRIYLLIISDTTRVDCATALCLSNPTFTSNPPTIVINFLMTTRLCKNGIGYNATIILKCHKESNEPSIVKESKCDVMIQWENAIACPIIKSEPKNLESPSIKAGYSTNTITFIVLAIILVLALIFTLFYYYRRQRRVRNTNSHIPLLNCEYSKEKDAAKIA